MAEADVNLSACPFSGFGACFGIAWRNMLVPAAVVLAAGAYMILWSFAQRKTKGPRNWPVIGVWFEIMANWRRMYDWLQGYFDEEGVIAVKLPINVSLYYVVDPVCVEHILKTNFSNYPKGNRVRDIVSELVGEGIFGSDGENWKQQRKVASFEFATSNLRNYSIDVFRDCSVKAVRILQEIAESKKPLDLQDLFMRMTLDSTCKIGFGIDLGSLHASMPAVPFGVAFDAVNDLSMLRFVDPLWKIKRYLLVGREKEIMKFRKIMDDFAYGIVEKRREEFRAMHTLAAVRQDLLSRFMMLKVGPDEYLSDEALRDHVLNFIIAGRDTTASTLSWFFYRLCLEPQVTAKLYEEIDSFAEREYQLLKINKESQDDVTKFATILTYDNLGELHYLHAAVSEALRLYPAVPVDMKEAVADDVLPDGTKIKAGSSVSYCPYNMGRTKSIWGPDAIQFKPERWFQNGVYHPESPYKFTVFQAGPRSCLGKDSAILQLKTTAAMLLRAYRFHLVPGQNVTPRVMFTLNMKDGVKVLVNSR